MTKRKKLTDQEIADLRKDISEVKDVFEDSHLGEKKPNQSDDDGPGALTASVGLDTDAIRRAFGLPEQPISESPLMSFHTHMTSPSLTIGGSVSDGSNTLFRIYTAEIHRESLPMGSGITSQYTVQAEVETSGFQVSRDTLYELYFNGGGRIYQGRVTVNRIEQNPQGRIIATMRVAGALNIT